ncbi:hypothetical protein TNCV_2076121 [Trichonephila clavipes]|nr:hypothetical protein TNCV_2076121 [Trichonephila clavipes]
MFRAYEPKGRGFYLLIGDLDAELRKRNCRGAVYSSQEQSKVVSSTRRSNLKAVRPNSRSSINSHARHNNYTVFLYKPVTASRLK